MVVKCAECAIDYKCDIAPGHRKDCVAHGYKHFARPCPVYCPDPDCDGETFVVYRQEKEGHIKRLRECKKCGERCYTREIIEAPA